MVDLTRPLEEDGSIEIVTPGSDEALEVLRHSTAHLMAQALKRLYGDVKFGVGPVMTVDSIMILIWMKRFRQMTLKKLKNDETNC